MNIGRGDIDVVFLLPSVVSKALREGNGVRNAECGDSAGTLKQAVIVAKIRAQASCRGNQLGA